MKMRTVRVGLHQESVRGTLFLCLEALIILVLVGKVAMRVELF
jgi:hypothetical protein